MDHAISALRPYYSYELDSVAQELASGQYERLSDCPSYKAAQALRNAICEMELCYHGKRKTWTIAEEMEFRGLMIGKKVIVC